jgi:hypothetical protein
MRLFCSLLPLYVVVISSIFDAAIVADLRGPAKALYLAFIALFIQ